MKSQKGQTGIALVILGVIAIIAVIGLVLLFTRASNPQGAALTELAIGNVYGSQGGERGISSTYPSPEYYPGTPAVSYPGYKFYPAAVQTRGSRTPAFIVSGKYGGGGYASIEDVYGCEWSLITGAKMSVPHDAFNCYAVPNKGPSEQGEVVGNYPPDSAAEARPTRDYMGKQGGDMYCYANSIGAEQQKPNSEDLIRENILTQVVEANAGQDRYAWTTANINGKTVPVCWVSAKAYPFDQGARVLS